MRKHTKDCVVGFYKGKDGETHPITKSMAELKQKKLITNPRSMKPVTYKGEIIIEKVPTTPKQHGFRIRIAGKVNGREVGGIDFSIKKTTKTATIHNIGLIEQGQHHGTKTIRTLENAWKKAGIKTIIVQDVTESEGFWQKLGYKPTGHARDWIKHL